MEAVKKYLLFLQYFFHLLPLSNLIYQLIEIPNISHEFILDFMDLVSTDAPSNECSIWIHQRGFSEEYLEIYLIFQHALESCLIISREPIDNLINFGFLSSLFLHFCNIEWVYFCDWHGEYFGIRHRVRVRYIMNLIIAHLDTKSSCRESFHIHDIQALFHRSWISF